MPGNISRILRNPFYCGIIEYRKQYVPDYLEQKKINNFGEVDKVVIQGKHVPIVSRETFEEVQKILDGRSISVHNKGKRGVRTSKDVWGRKLICECKHKYNQVIWHRSENGLQYAYQCRNQANTSSYETRKRNSTPRTQKIVLNSQSKDFADIVFPAINEER